MSEETVLTPITPAEGTMPPKVSPFGDAAPAAESAPAAPAAEPATTAAAPSTGTKTLKLRPVIRKPVIRKPTAAGTATAPKLPDATAPAATPAATPAPAAPTAAPAAEAPATPAQNPKSITGAIPAPAILKKTGIIAEGILTPSQAQAAKTKTSRISLESAMGVPPPSTGSSSPLKTIKLRRPTGIKAPTRPASPMSSGASPIKPAAPAAPSPAPVADDVKSMDAIPPVADMPAETAAAPTEAVTESSEKKTVKLRRPTAGIKKPTISTAPIAPEASADGLDEIKDIPDFAPIGDFPVEAPQKSSPLAVITLVASIAAIAILGVVTYQLFSQSVGPVTGPNEFAFIEG